MAVHHDGGRALVLTGGTGGEFRTVAATVEAPGDALTVVAVGDATVALDCVRVSTDADGLADPHERVGCLPTAFGCVGTSPSAADSDGDGLADGREVGTVRTDALDFGLFGTVAFEYLALSSRPDDPDTDGDGLSDGTEVDGWEVPVERADLSALATADGAALDHRPVRYDPSSATTKHPDSDPMTPDTDGDGVWDGWVGVHGAGNSENVVLYMEHLSSGDGWSATSWCPNRRAATA